MDKHIAKFYEEVKKDLAGSDEEKVRRALRLCFAGVMVEERERSAQIAKEMTMDGEVEETRGHVRISLIAEKILAGAQ